MGFGLPEDKPRGLDHVGRASGRRFTTPLLYLEDGLEPR